MRIAIVDDDAAERELLLARLEKQFSDRDIFVQLQTFECGEKFLADTSEKPYSVVFLDIYMEQMNGIETAKQLRSFDPSAMIVFTTTSTEHALDGFRVRAMQYLVKPYDDAVLSDLVDELLTRMPAPDKYMQIKSSASVVKVPFRDILYAEHFSHMIYVHLKSGKELVTRLTFGEFLALLKNDKRFFQCNRGEVVNLEHVSDFDGKVFLLGGGTSVKVSRDLVKTARQTFMDFLFQRGHT